MFWITEIYFLFVIYEFRSWRKLCCTDIVSRTAEAIALFGCRLMVVCLGFEMGEWGRNITNRDEDILLLDQNEKFGKRKIAKKRNVSLNFLIWVPS